MSCYVVFYGFYFLTWSYDEISGRLFKYLLTEDAFSQLFIDNAIVYLGTYFFVNTTQDLLDSLSGNIATEMQYHRQKWSHVQDRQESLSDMRTFFLRRPSYAYQQIADFYGLILLLRQLPLPSAKHLCI